MAIRVAALLAKIAVLLEEEYRLLHVLGQDCIRNVRDLRYELDKMSEAIHPP